MTPRPYQHNAIEIILSKYREGARRLLLAKATGTGKTVTYGFLQRYMEDSDDLSNLARRGLLILVHLDELATQTANTMRMIHSERHSIGVEMGQRSARGDEGIVVASVQTLGRSGSRRIEKFRDRFGTVIVDEAHHCKPDSLYSRVLSYFDLGPENHGSTDRLLLGATATPNRGDRVGLHHFFDHIVENPDVNPPERGWDIRWGINAGYLVPVRARRVETTTDLSDVRVRAGDFRREELENAVDTDDRNEAIARAVHNRFEEGSHKVIVFCQTINHAIHLNRTIEEYGMTSHVIFSERQNVWPRSVEDIYGAGTTCRQIIQTYREGSRDVLCNVGMATEGFDVRSIDTVVMARPTLSSGLYTQMVGRGTRIVHEPEGTTDLERREEVAASSKPELWILDMVDNVGRHAQSIMRAPRLFGLNSEFDDESAALNIIADQIDQMELSNPLRPYRLARSLEDVSIIEQEITVFDMAQPPVTVLTSSENVWLEVAPGRLELSIPARMIGERQDAVLTLEETALGQWQTRLNVLGRYDPDQRRYLQPTSIESPIKYDSVDDALKRCDKWVRQRYPGVIKFTGLDQPWHDLAPTPGQLRELQRRHVNVPESLELDRFHASRLISSAAARRRNS